MSSQLTQASCAWRLAGALTTCFPDGIFTAVATSRRQIHDDACNVASCTCSSAPCTSLDSFDTRLTAPRGVSRGPLQGIERWATPSQQMWLRQAHSRRRWSLHDKADPPPDKQAVVYGAGRVVVVGYTWANGKSTKLFAHPELTPGSFEPDGSLRPGAGFSPAATKLARQQIVIGTTIVNGKASQLFSYPETLSEAQLYDLHHPAEAGNWPSVEAAVQSNVHLSTTISSQEGPTIWQLKLNARLKRSKSVQEVVTLVLTHHQDFDCVNASTALGRLQVHGVMGNQADAQVQKAISTLETLLAHKAPKSGGVRQMANAAHSLANMQLGGEDFFKALESLLLNHPNDFKPAELAMALRAFAVSGHASQDVLSAVSNQLRQRLREFTSQEIANIAWSFGSVRVNMPDVMEVICQAVAAEPSQFTSQQLANVMWACGRLLHDSPELLAVVGKEMISRIHDFKTQEVAMVTWTFGRLRAEDADYLLKAVSNDFLLRAEEYSPTSLTNVIWTFGVLGVQVPAMFDKAALMALQRLEEFMPMELTRVAFGFANAGVESPLLFDSIASALEPHVDDVAVGDIASLLWAFTTQAHPAPLLFSAAEASLSGRLPSKGTEGSCATAVWAVAASHRSAPELFSIVAQRVAPVLDELSPRSISMLAYAFSAVSESDLHPQLISGLRAQFIARLDKFLPQESIITLWSLSAAGLLDEATAEAARVALMTSPAEDLTEIDLMQLYQADLASNGVLLDLDRSLRIACKRTWLVESEKAVVVSNTCLEVSETLFAMGVPNQSGVRTREGQGLLIVDVLAEIGEKAVAFELDGPGRRCVNDPTIELGKTALKRRLLQAHGLVVITIPFYEWDALRDHTSREQYLSSALWSQAQMQLTPQNQFFQSL